MKLRFLFLIVFLILLPRLTVSQQAAKPMSKDQIMSVVTAGIDNAELAKKIEERGIDFDLTDDYLQTLRKAGAEEVVIKALRTVKPSPMSRDQLLMLVASGVPSERAAALVKQRGVDFMPDDKLLESLRTAGADDKLITAVRQASEVQQHLARAAECEQKHAWAQAQQEYRAALALAPGNAEILRKADRLVARLKLPQFKFVKKFNTSKNAIYCMGRTLISPDARWIAAACDGVEIWDVASGGKGPMVAGAGYNVFSPDGRWFAARRTGDPSGVGVWAVGTWGEAVVLEKADWPWALQFSPDGRLLAVGAGFGEVQLWDLTLRRDLYHLQVGATTRIDSSVGAIAFSPDGRWMAAAANFTGITLWDAATGQQVRTLIHDASLTSHHLAFSPDGRWLLSTGDALRVWDVVTGKQISTLEDADDLVFTDAGWLVSLRRKHGLSIWDVAAGRQVGSFGQDIDDDLRTLSLSADGQWLGAASDKTLYLWQRQD
jgi:WD40 repeat protein